MAIVPLNRVTLIGQVKDRAKVVAELQRLGCLHVVDLGDNGGNATRSVIGQDDLKAAVDFLQRCPEQRPHSQPPGEQMLTAHPDPRREHDAVKHVVAEVLEIESESRALAEERESIDEKIEQTKPWGNFHLPAADELGGRTFYFYSLTHRQARDVRAASGPELSFTRIDSDRQREYWVVIGTEPPSGMPVEPESLDPRPLSELEARGLEIDARREALHLKRIALTGWIDRMRLQQHQMEDETSRLVAAGRSLVDGPLFVMQGWVPRKRLTELETFASGHTMVLRSRKPKPDELPPTLLSNPRPIAGAEGAVTFFMTPGYRAWDPTLVMYFSFAAFFAMILADAGYGIVLGVILAFLARPLGRTEAGRRFRQLAVFMVAVTVGFGVLIGSYFGFSPPDGSLLDRLVIKSDGRSIMQDREAMMLVSGTIGVFHLVLANLIVAWRWIGSGHALSSVGWAITMIGGWMLALAMIPKPNTSALFADWFGGQSEQWTQQLSSFGWAGLITGLVLVLLFSSMRPVFSSNPKDWLMRAVDGVMGLTGVTKAFGDALSYLRLFALGLASAQLAIIFNQLASDASQVKGVGILLGLLIFLIGHTLNLVLAVVGGVVHGLRLNCIEFFSWSLTDEGQPFEALEMKAEK